MSRIAVTGFRSSQLLMDEVVGEEQWRVIDQNGDEFVFNADEMLELRDLAAVVVNELELRRE